MRKRIQIIAAVVLTVCLFLTGFILSIPNTEESPQSEASEAPAAETSEVSSQPGITSSPARPDNESLSAAPESTSEPEVFDPVQQIDENPDCIGWISLPDTEFDFPVMQTKDNPNYYLTHNFYQENTGDGVPYLDSRCGVYESDNLIIYSGNTEDETLSVLQQYTEPSFLKEHPDVVFTDLYERVPYRIFAVCSVSGATEEETALLDGIDFESEQDFDEWLQFVTEKSLYDTGTMPEYGERFMTISITKNSQEEDIFIIVGFTENHVH